MLGAVKINERLKMLRTAKGLSQSEMAEAIDVSLSSYQKYEREKNSVTPSLDVLISLSDFFDISLDYLLGREPQKDPFAELSLCAEDEQAVIDKYMSLPPEIRAMLLDVMRQLGEAASHE